MRHSLALQFWHSLTKNWLLALILGAKNKLILWPLPLMNNLLHLVIPAKTGIQTNEKLDTRQRSLTITRDARVKLASGMTGVGKL